MEQVMSNNPKYLLTLLSVRLYNETCLLFLRRIVEIVLVLLMKRTSHCLQ